MINFAFSSATLMCFFLLTGCQTLDRLADVGEPPAITTIENPITNPTYKPVVMPMPQSISSQGTKNSLWQIGARSFFKDQRAGRVGDILTVHINIDEKAELSSASNSSRTSGQKIGVNNLFGYEATLNNLFPQQVDLTNLLSLSSNPTHTGAGAIKRKETIITNLAATIIQILPNGNLVIQGRQEVRVNYEVREVILTGIVRSSDIASDNSIPLEKIADARVSYGGRGQIDDAQQAPAGQQIINLLSPL